MATSWNSPREQQIDMFVIISETIHKIVSLDKHVCHAVLQVQIISPSTTYMRRCTGSDLIQLMACCLFGAKSLPEPVLDYHQLESWEQISVLIGIPSFSFKKMHLKMLFAKMAAIFSRWRWFNWLRPSDVIWRHRSGSTLAQVMVCCLTAPSHYLNQCWLLISKVHRHSFEYNFTRDTSAIIH